MNISRWNRLGTLLSLVAIFWMALAPISACACGFSGAAPAATARVMVCSHCGETAARASDHSRDCCRKHRPAKTSCHCEVAAAVAAVAPDSSANSVRFDVGALVFAPTINLRAPVWMRCDFAPPIHGPPHLLVAHRFSSRAPPF